MTSRGSSGVWRTEWQQTLDRLIERMHASRGVGLLPTDRVDSPSVIGWLRPVILAPVGVLCGLAPEQIEALLAHVLAHVRRHDYMVNVLQGNAESLLLPSCGVVDLKPDPGRARAWLR